MLQDFARRPPYLYEQMDFPSTIVLDEDTSWKGATGDDEDYCDAEICHDGFLLFLVGSRDLDLGG